MDSPRHGNKPPNPPKVSPFTLPSPSLTSPHENMTLNSVGTTLLSVDLVHFELGAPFTTCFEVAYYK